MAFHDGHDRPFLFLRGLYVLDIIVIVYGAVDVDLYLDHQHIVCEVANRLIVLHGRDGEYVDTTMLVASGACSACGVGMSRAATEELHWTALCSNDDMLFGMHDTNGERCFAFICCCCCCW